VFAVETDAPFEREALSLALHPNAFAALNLRQLSPLPAGVQIVDLHHECVP